MKDTQVSAVISAATKELLDCHVRATGVKKGHVLEMALLHHLQALHEAVATLQASANARVTRQHDGEQRVSVAPAVFSQTPVARAAPSDQWRGAGAAERA